jgi:hypothetical protein
MLLVMLVAKKYLKEKNPKEKLKIEMKYANVKCKLRRSEAVLENRTKIAEYKNSAVRGHSTEPWECSMKCNEPTIAHENA